MEDIVIGIGTAVQTLAPTYKIRFNSNNVNWGL